MSIWDKFTNILFSDGSCENATTKNGGWSYILLYKKGQIEIQESGFETKTTNNRMELLGIIKGLQKIKEINLQGRILVLSDSLLSINCASHLWRRKKNLDLWEIFDGLDSFSQTQFSWIKGHSGLEYNEKCDDLAEVSCNLQESYFNEIHRENSILLKEILPYAK